MTNYFEFLHLKVTLTPHGPLTLRNASTSLRGALGLSLAAHLFNPQIDVPRPSGFVEIPRPFVLRAHHLTGLTLPAGEPFSFAVSLFHLPYRSELTETLHKMAAQGLGPGRIECAVSNLEWRSLNFPLTNPGPSSPSSQLEIDFQTPLELRSAGRPVSSPEFPVLIARLRDRISALSAFYGNGPPDIDFAHFTRIAESVRLVSHRLEQRRARRLSTRTLQWHPLNGFTGPVLYEGPWRAYENWLRLGEYTGAGKQTAFGKGAFVINYK